MKLFTILISTIALSSLAVQSNAQRLCGNSIRLQQLQKTNPAAFSAMRAAHSQMAQDAVAKGQTTQTAAKGTGLPKIAVVFHYVLTQTMLNRVGGVAALKQRADSQIAVFNRDFTASNKDSIRIPSWFKPYFGNNGLTFGLAAKTPAGATTNGVEYKILAAGVDSSFNFLDGCHDAKFSTARGLNAWDVTKYLNIWVCDILLPAQFGGGIILGVTTPPSDVPHQYATAGEVGIALNYGAVGKRRLSTDYYIPGIDLGRTATHEMGHFFELYHTWGDDDGHCPGQIANGQQVGFDDDITDTPPQADQTYGTPSTQVRLYDSCSSIGTNGIMFMNYMDYVDDTAMQMFTKEQVTVMRSNFIPAGSESYSLTQHPELLGITDAVANTFQMSVFPNPANAVIVITIPNTVIGLQSLQVMNTLGQTVVTLPIIKGQQSFTTNLSALSKGLYIIRAQAENGTATEKLLLQ